MNTAIIPWHHVNMLSYGRLDSTMSYFASWLDSAPEAVIIPRGENVLEHYVLALAVPIIREIAKEKGKIVFKERKK